MKSGIKDHGLQTALPADSLLRRYLEDKPETGRRPYVAASPEYVGMPAPWGRKPRTLLIMPPIMISEGAVKRVIPPLGLCYIAAYLESVGIDCDILDCIVEGVDQETYVGDGMWRFGLTPDRIRSRIADYRPDIVGISILYSSDLPNLYAVARIAKEACPEVVVVAGGIHPTIYPNELLTESIIAGHPTVDFVIRGEGEHRMAEFIENYQAGRLNRKADGLAGFHDGAIFINPQIATIDDIDALPYPAYHKLPMEKYFEFNVPFSPFPRGKRVMQIYTSRGCPISCTFCASTNFNKQFRARSVNNVISEIRLWKDVYSIDELQFADDNLTLNRGRAEELFDALRREELPWCTPNGIMVNTLTKELLDKMIASGMYQITMSLDSGSARTLKELHRKPVNLQRVPDLMAYLVERGVLIHGTLVIGMPGETIADIAEGFAFVESLPFHSIGVFIAQAIPGSELYEISLASGAVMVESARQIDTARSRIKLSTIAQDELEKLAASFIYRMNNIIRRRDPDAWDKKYRHHRQRMKQICIGTAAPNTDAVIQASGTGTDGS